MIDIKSKIKDREQIIDGLYQNILVNKTVEDQYEDGVIDSHNLDKISIILEHKNEIIDFMDDNLKSGWILSKLAAPVQAILMNAYYEIKYQKLDKKIAINEAVIYSEAYAPGEDYKFVNAILDKIEI